MGLTILGHTGKIATKGLINYFKQCHESISVCVCQNLNFLPIMIVNILNPSSKI